MNRITEVFLVFLKLGCTSFGGPIAHLGYFQDEFVEKRRWIAPETFSELIALAQSLPGPASSQVGYSVGLLRAGLAGGIAAWMGFTLPSALLMLAFAFGHSLFAGKIGASLLHGLQLAAVAVVAQAVLAMQRKLAPDRKRFAIACAAAAVVLLVRTPGATVAAILTGAIAGLFLVDNSVTTSETGPALPSPSRSTGVIALVLFAVCLTDSLLFSGSLPTPTVLFATFFRAGSLVFGGGHVVLPLLDSVTVARGWISQERFLSGYGAAQAIPGPLFAFSAFLGAAVEPNQHIYLGSLSSLIGIFSPGLLLITGVLPFWGSLRSKGWIQRVLLGLNAAVVGILIAALYNPVWTTSVHSALDFLIALGAFTALVQWRVQPWIVVVAVAGISGFRGLFF